MAQIGNRYRQHYKDQFQLCIENMPIMEGFFMQPADIRDYFDQPELEDIGLTLDTAHAWTCGGDEIIESFIELLPDKLAHVHLVDNNSFTNDPHLEIGIGNINFEQCMEELKGIGYKGTVTYRNIREKCVLTIPRYYQFLPFKINN